MTASPFDYRMIDMKTLASTASEPLNLTRDPRTLLASRRHTLYFFGICVVLSVVSAVIGSHGSKSAYAPSQADLIKGYLFMIAIECLWVLFVYAGMQNQGHSLAEIFGRRWLEPGQLVQDVAYAALTFGVIFLLDRGTSSLLRHAGQVTIDGILPSTPLAKTLCVGLSMAAGVGEEIVFRGYLQRQLKALTGSTVIAILGQAVLFALGHGYEGPGIVLDIFLEAIVWGALAAWRGNIRSGILVHVAWDVLAGFGII